MVNTWLSDAQVLSLVLQAELTIHTLLNMFLCSSAGRPLKHTSATTHRHTHTMCSLRQAACGLVWRNYIRSTIDDRSAIQSVLGLTRPHCRRRERDRELTLRHSDELGHRENSRCHEAVLEAQVTCEQREGGGYYYITTVSPTHTGTAKH